MLLKAPGIDVNAIGERGTPLHMARNNEPMAQLLRDAGGRDEESGADFT